MGQGIKEGEAGEVGGTYEAKVLVSDDCVSLKSLGGGRRKVFHDVLSGILHTSAITRCIITHFY